MQAARQGSDGDQGARSTQCIVEVFLEATTINLSVFQKDGRPVRRTYRNEERPLVRQHQRPSNQKSEQTARGTQLPDNCAAASSALQEVNLCCLQTEQTQKPCPTGLRPGLQRG